MAQPIWLPGCPKEDIFLAKKVLSSVFSPYTNFLKYRANNYLPIYIRFDDTYFS